MAPKKPTAPEAEVTSIAPEQSPADIRREELRKALRYTYDLQKLRIQQGNRGGPQAEESEAELDPQDKGFFNAAALGLRALEKSGFKEVERLLKGIPIYDHWLKNQKGVGPAMAGVLLSELDIHKADTVSKFWAVAGLHVKDGRAPRRKTGEKANWNPFLKAKLTKVLAESFIKSRSPWRDFYDNYKNRKQNQMVPVCMLCNGTKVVTVTEEARPAAEGEVVAFNAKKPKKATPCYNCKGADGNPTGGPAPWGRSDAHRHQAAMRYMVKMFLMQLHIEWRTLEGLPVRPPYAEEYLGRVHHS